MGQYLAIGLATMITVNKKKVESARLTVEQLQERMTRELHFVPEIYVLHVHEDGYIFILKEDIFVTQLLPLLETLYPLLYQTPASYENVLQKLHQLPPTDWIPFAREHSEEAFQLDDYSMWEILHENHRTIELHYDSLVLSMEGKVIMEEYRRHFKFMTYLMRQGFQQFSLSGALRLNITG